MDIEANSDHWFSAILKRVSSSVIAYLVLLVAIIIFRLLISLFPSGMIASQMVNLTDTLSIGAIWVVGWVGVYLAKGTGFAGMWQKDISLRRRFLEPALIGIGIGVLAIIFDLLQPLGGESLIRFPASLVAYPLAAILEEIIFRLFLTTTIVWIFSNVLLRGKWQEVVFWVVNVFLALFYTLSQLSQYQTYVGDLNIIVLARFFVVIAVFFILAAFYYRRTGFLSAIVMHLGYFLVWFIIWGALVRG
jgi:membrane protease YdiL (CAAX protease family)